MTVCTSHRSHLQPHTAFGIDSAADYVWFHSHSVLIDFWVSVGIGAGGGFGIMPRLYVLDVSSIGLAYQVCALNVSAQPHALHNLSMIG